MHKNVGAAIIRQDEAKPAICVEEFDPPTWHARLIRSQRTVSAPTRDVGRDSGPGLGTTRCSEGVLSGLPSTSCPMTIKGHQTYMNLTEDVCCHNAVAGRVVTN